MKIQRTILASCVVLTSLLPAGADEDGVWALAYFRQRYPTRVEIDADGKVHDVPLPEPMSVEKLHLALSRDGRHWTPLNGNEPVWGQRLRDPFIRKAPDGTWHLMGTGRAPDDPRNRQRPLCLHATSRDLITWDTVESLPLMEGVRDGQSRPARNIWAPEWFRENDSDGFLLLWSSSFEDAGWKKSRLWYSRTRDWKSFTPARELFAPPYSVIDGSLWESGGTYYLYHKEEEFGARGGERRAIRVATSDHAVGPFKIHEGPLNGGQIVPTITEGCSIMPDPLGPGWLLLYDFCMSNRFGASHSKDLIHWELLDDVGFPPDARHGSVFKLSNAEAERLQQAFKTEGR